MGLPSGRLKLEIMVETPECLFTSDGRMHLPMMADAAALVAEMYAPDYIDINFGCPVKKVVKRNGGSGCLRDLDLALTDLAANARDFYAAMGRLRREDSVDEAVFLAYKDHPDLAKWLMEQGIESVSLNPDSVLDTWFFLADEKID